MTTKALFMLNHLIHSFDRDDESKLVIPIEYIIHEILLEKFAMIQPIYDIYFQYNPEFIIHKTQRKSAELNIKFMPYEAIYPIDYDTRQPSIYDRYYEEVEPLPEIIDIKESNDESKYEYTPMTELHIDYTIMQIKADEEDDFSSIDISLHVKDNHLILMEYLHAYPNDHFNSIFVAIKPLDVNLLRKTISMKGWEDLKHWEDNAGDIFNLLKDHFGFDKLHASTAGWG